MALITPTTTMMREGISQASTKIDAGFRGNLNWGLRNCSSKDLIIKYGEPIFKLTIFLLTENEIPEMPYGNREADKYQDTNGIKLSARQIPADIPKHKIISSSFDKLDPKKQLREAGYPFDHISTELTVLHGKFEVVSKDVVLLKDQFKKQTDELSEKIMAETKTLSEKLNELRQNILERAEAIFSKKFYWVIGIIIGALSVLYGGISYLEKWTSNKNTLAFIGIVVGVVIIAITHFVNKRTK
ncbi:MAG: hypothetical protein NT009_00765 [Proteobacteria bacterium]|nr:hypothetical protein [Pseudomonadota bacterium]